MAHMRIVEKPPVAVERLSISTLIACLRDRVEAARDGVQRLGDLAVLRQQAEMYFRESDELRALIGELDRLGAGLA
jgi:hypothetical protein